MMTNYKNQTAQYVRGFTIPKSIPEGRKLCHNHVYHTKGTSCGIRGFRAWTVIEPPSHFVKCPCGWSGLPHYASRDHVKTYKKDGTLRKDVQAYFDKAFAKERARYRKMGIVIPKGASTI